MTADRTATAAKLEHVWRSISQLGAGLTEDEWKRPTACPGWSVQDHLSHLVSTERSLAGDPGTTHRAGDLAHAKNPIGEANEHEVDSRRHLPGAEVLAEWDGVVERRLAWLRDAPDEAFAADSWTPVGPGTVLDFLQIRIMDAWVHELDMRRAVGQPGDEDGIAAEHAVDRLLLAFPLVVGKRAGTPEGATVVLRLTGPVAREVAVTVTGGRAARVDAVPAEVAATVTTTSTTWMGLATGRLGADEAAADVELAGDVELGRRVLAGANTMI